MFIKANKERYTAIQVIIIISSIIVHVWINREDLVTNEGWINLLIYTIFNVSIMIAGQKTASIKTVMTNLQSVYDGEGSAENKLNESLYVLKGAALGAGIAFERFNVESIKKEKKKKEKKEKIESQ